MSTSHEDMNLERTKSSAPRKVMTPPAHLGLDIDPELADLFAEASIFNAHRDHVAEEKVLDAMQAIVDSRISEGKDYYQSTIFRLRASVHFLREEFDKGIELFNRTIAMCLQMDDKVGEALCVMGIGNCLNHSSRFSESITYHRRAVDMLLELKEYQFLIQGLINLSISEMGNGQYANALEVNKRALQYAKDLGEVDMITQLHMNIAAPYFYTGDYASAIKHSMMAYDLGIREGNAMYAMMAAGNIAYVSFMVGALEIARKWSSMVTAFRADQPMSADKLNTMLNDVMIDARMKQDRGSLQILQDMVNEHLEGPYAREAVQSASYLSESLERFGEHEAAVDIAARALTRAEAMGFYPVIPQLRLTLLELRTIAECTAEDAQLCLDLLEQARNNNELSDIERGLMLAARLFEKLGDHSRSVEYYKQYITEHEENSSRRSRHITEMAEVQFEHDRLNQLSAKQHELLSSVMPDGIAERLMSGEEHIADSHESVSVMFMDLVSFTNLASNIPAGHVIHLLNAVFEKCDDVIRKHGLTKIKTIGDSYLAVSGLMNDAADHHVRMASAAIELVAALRDLQVQMPKELGDTSWTSDFGDISVRIGLHSGPLVAGVIGTHRAQYDVWGDTVNVASRMESSGEPDRIQVSEDFAMALANGASPEFEGTDVVIRQAPYLLRLRGTSKIKGKGDMKTFWLEGA